MLNLVHGFNLILFNKIIKLLIKSHLECQQNNVLKKYLLLLAISNKKSLPYAHHGEKL